MPTKNKRKPARPAAPKHPAKRITAAKAKRAAKVDLIIDQRLERQWKEALATLQAARREGSSAFDELWETVAFIVEHDPPLYLAGGFATTKAFITKHLGETERTAKRHMRIAKYASPAEETRYGLSKLDAALDLLQARTGGPPRARVPVDFTKLRIPLIPRPREGTRTISFAQATVAQIQAATRALTRTSAPRAKRSPVEKAILAALKGTPLSGVTVRLANGHITIGNIPEAHVARLGAALSSFNASKKSAAT